MPLLPEKVSRMPETGLRRVRGKGTLRDVCRGVLRVSTSDATPAIAATAAEGATAP